MIETTWKNLGNNNLIGKVFLLPTDTIYGFHVLAKDLTSTEKLKRIKERNDSRFFIILISDISEIANFNIKLTITQIKFLQKIWPGRYTIIFQDKIGQTRSFRMPDKKELLNFIEEVGPLYSTSANFHGEKNIFLPKDLHDNLKSQVDFYIDEGQLESEPSLIFKNIR